MARYSRAFGTAHPTEDELRYVQDCFLWAYVATGWTITHAAAEAGVSVSSITNWRERDTLGFKGRFEQAVKALKDALEHEAFGRALGRLPSDRHSNILLLRLLGVHDERYRERQQVDVGTTPQVQEYLRNLDMVYWGKQGKSKAGGSDTGGDTNREAEATSDDV